MIAIPTFVGVRELIGRQDVDVIAFDGYDVLDRNTTDYEPRIFRYDPGHTRYEDWDLYEVLKHEYPKVFLHSEKCYLHMKLVKRDWLHKSWVSPNDTAIRSAPAPGSGLLRDTPTSRVASRVRSVVRRVLKG